MLQCDRPRNRRMDASPVENSMRQDLRVQQVYAVMPEGYVAAQDVVCETSAAFEDILMGSVTGMIRRNRQAPESAERELEFGPKGKNGRSTQVPPTKR